MNQRGMATGWIYLIVLAVVIAALAGLYSKGRNDGRELERGEWQKRENAQLLAAQTKYKELEEKYRAREREHAGQVAAIAEQFEKDKVNETQKRDRVIADLRSGAVRLRIPVAGCTGPGGSGVPSAGTGAGVSPSGATAELSIALSVALSELMAEADTVAVQLRACQAIVQADRASSGGSKGR